MLAAQAHAHNDNATATLTSCRDISLKTTNMNLVVDKQEKSGDVQGHQDSSFREPRYIYVFDLDQSGGLANQQIIPRARLLAWLKRLFLYFVNAL